MSLQNNLLELFQSCAVRLCGKRWQGTGFFIQPLWIATCAHVVALEDLGSSEFRIEWGDQSLTGRIVSRFPDIVPQPPAPIFPDVAFIRVENTESKPLNHSWVVLDDAWEPGDSLYSFGFPKGRFGESISGDLEGFRADGNNEDEQLLKFKQTQVQPGASGSPVLNLNTLRVCGMIKRTRDEQSDLGGLAVRARTLKKYLQLQVPDILNCPVWDIAAVATVADRARPNRSGIDVILQRYRAGLRASDPFRERESGVHLQARVTLVDRRQPKDVSLATMLDTWPDHGGIALLGDAGQGKSYALESLMIEQLRRENACVPVLVPLKYYVGEISLIPLLRETLSTISGVPVSEADVEAILGEGCLVLADGLNEIASENREKAARLISRLVAAHPKARIMVSCRISDFTDFGSALPEFETWALCPWTLPEIRRYLLSAAPAAIEGFNLEEQAVAEMLSNPLLLRLAVESGTESRVPITAAGLLQRFVDGNRVAGAIFPSAHRRRTLRALQGVAWSLHHGQKLTVPIDEVVRTLEHELNNQQVDADELLMQLQRAGLMWADARRSGFTHQFIQEYFAALYLVSRGNAGLAAGLACHSWWRECLVLYLNLPELNSSSLESFLAPTVDRWVRYIAAHLAFRTGRLNDEEMISVDGGGFRMGRNGATPIEAPTHELEITPFQIAKYPVTNRLYAEFVRETGHPPPPQWRLGRCPERIAYVPVVNVGFEDAEAYCRWRRVRLPSEAEWEFAACGGPNSRKSVFPWGDDFDAQRLNSDVDARYSVGAATTPGAYFHGASRLGVCDMAGNVWEWTASPMRTYPFDPAAEVGRDGPPVLRGGSWRSVVPGKLTTTFRDSFPQTSVSGDNVGFRVASDLNS